MENHLNSLTKGQCLLIQAKKTRNPNKVQLEFAEVLGSNADNPLAMFNRSDDRFKTRARRAWMTVMIADASGDLNVNLGDDAKWQMGEDGRHFLPLNILNPGVGDRKLRIRIVETQEGDQNSGLITEWMRENIERSAKRRGAEGDFITKNGKHIFSKEFVVWCAEGQNPDNHFISDIDSINSVGSSVSTADKIVDEVGM